MTTTYNKSQIGNEGEHLALDYLLQKGFVLLTSKFRNRWGEIDLIMQQTDCLVFIEVKYRRQTRFGHPLEAVSVSKRNKMLKVAEYYLMTHPHAGPVRFDVVGIVQMKGQAPVFIHVENALA